MNISEWMKAIHKHSVEKGWYNPPKSPLENHMLIVSEVAEATEEVRKGMPPVYTKSTRMEGSTATPLEIEIKDLDVYLNDDEFINEPLKLEGELIELADIMIRVMDYAESKGWDLEKAIEAKHNFNCTRPYRHGGKLF